MSRVYRGAKRSRSDTVHQIIMIFIGDTKNNQKVYIVDPRSHFLTHLKSEAGLEELVKEVLPQIVADGENQQIEFDLKREVGLSDLVETTDQDEIIYAKRIGREEYTRFAKNRDPVASTTVVVVLQKIENGYELLSAWIGKSVPPFPGNKRERPESKEYWKNHALVWGRQSVVSGTETDKCPW